MQIIERIKILNNSISINSKKLSNAKGLKKRKYQKKLNRFIYERNVMIVALKSLRDAKAKGISDNPVIGGGSSKIDSFSGSNIKFEPSDYTLGI